MSIILYFYNYTDYILNTFLEYFWKVVKEAKQTQQLIYKNIDWYLFIKI